MTEVSIVLLNHPLGYAALAVLAIAALALAVAAINLALTARLLTAHRKTTTAGAGAAARTGAPAAVAGMDERAIVAAIAAAVTATVGAHRIIYIGAQQSGSSWSAAMRSRHHASHMPQQPH